MKVSQLIEALQQMPPDADVLTHTNNHTSGEDDSVRVGFATHVWGGKSWPRVIVGNWCDYNLICWKDTHIVMADESLAVLSYGDNKGKLIKQRHVFKPKRQVERVRREDTEERFELETLEWK